MTIHYFQTNALTTNFVAEIPPAYLRKRSVMAQSSVPIAWMKYLVLGVRHVKKILALFVAVFIAS